MRYGLIEDPPHDRPRQRPLQWMPRLLSPRHDPTDARTRRLIWTYEHEVIATAAGPTAVLRYGETGECIYLGRDGCTIHDRAPAI